MGDIKLGLNLEFARPENQGFNWAMDHAAAIGYKYIEPMVHWGRELLSAAGYFHSLSMLDDPLILKKAAEDRGLRISSLSSHAPLAKPDVERRLSEASRSATRPRSESPMIMVDDGAAAGRGRTEDGELHPHALHAAGGRDWSPNRAASRSPIETHGPYTATPRAAREDHDARSTVPALTINLDTGNSYLSENDPHEWLEQIVGQVAHLHAKDIGHRRRETAARQGPRHARLRLRRRRHQLEAHRRHADTTLTTTSCCRSNAAAWTPPRRATPTYRLSSMTPRPRRRWSMGPRQQRHPTAAHSPTSLQGGPRDCDPALDQQQGIPGQRRQPRLPVTNPATGAVTGEVALATVADARAVIDAAAAAFPAWRDTSLATAQRRSCSTSASCSTPARRELAEIITSEHGKVVSDALGRGQPRGQEVVEFACGVPHLLKGGFTENASTKVDVYSIRQPLGPVGDHLARSTSRRWCRCGFSRSPSPRATRWCSNPREKDPSASLWIAELWAEAGLPPGVFNVLQGDKTAVDELLTNPAIKSMSLRRVHPDRALCL